MGFTSGINLGTINLSLATPATPRILPYQYKYGIGYPIPHSWKASGSPSAHFLQGIEIIFLSPYTPSVVEAGAAVDIPSAVATYQKSGAETAAAATVQDAGVIRPADTNETVTALSAQDAVVELPVSIVEPATATETVDAVIIPGGGGPVIYDVSVTEMAVALSHEDGLIYPHVITAFNPLSAKNVTRYSPGRILKKKNRIYASYFK
jgi:hypothetical protein